MKGKVFFTWALALLLALFLMAQTNAEAKYKWRKLKITEVFISCDTNVPEIEINGKDLDFGRGPLTVVLGEYGELEIIDATEEFVIAKAPPRMCETPGDFMLTITNGRGFRVRDKWNLTIGAGGQAACDQAKLDAIINILCDDGNECTTEGIDIAAGKCSHSWPDCGLDDGCCGPDCTSENDADCARANKIVFVTSQAFTGNLGGVEGADTICKNAAAQAGLPRSNTYLAWIADSNPLSSPYYRFTKNDVPYVLVDGTTVVADSWSDLTDGTLHHGIDMNENGTAGVVGVVWTNVQADGQIYGTDPHYYSCLNWSTDSVDAHGLYGGITNEWGDSWTVSSLSACHGDDTGLHLYCFEQ